MIYTNTETVTTVWDIVCAIREINPVMFKDMHEKHVLKIIEGSMGRKLKVDKEFYGTMMFLNEFILLLYNAKQNHIPDDMNIYLETWQATIYPLFKHYVTEGHGRFIFIRVKK